MVSIEWSAMTRSRAHFGLAVCLFTLTAACASAPIPPPAAPTPGQWSADGWPDSERRNPAAFTPLSAEISPRIVLDSPLAQPPPFPGWHQLDYDAATDRFIVDGELVVDRAGAVEGVKDPYVNTHGLGLSLVSTPTGVPASPVAAMGNEFRDNGRLHVDHVWLTPSGSHVVLGRMDVPPPHPHACWSRARMITVVDSTRGSGLHVMLDDVPRLSTFLGDGTFLFDTTGTKPRAWTYGGDSTVAVRVPKRRVVALTPEGRVESFSRATLRKLAPAGADRVWAITRRHVLLGAWPDGRIFFRRRFRGKGFPRLLLPRARGICVISSPRMLHCLDDDGSIRWSRSVARAYSILVTIDGPMYFASYKTLEALDDHGNSLWQMPFEPTSNLVLTPRGSLCLLTGEPTRLVCLEGHPTAPALAPAGSSG